MKIPDRWMNYSRSGRIIESTPFVAFKTPLSQNYDRKLSVQKRFHPSMLPEILPQLAVVIDLTNSDRYYDPEELRQLGIDHVKLKVPGKQLPPEELVLMFFEEADKYLFSSQNEAAGNLIGVHCTHGLNRTGYFICRYLIGRLGWTPRDAIEEFERARGYRMERPHYVDSLRTFAPFEPVRLRNWGQRHYNY